MDNPKKHVTRLLPRLSIGLTGKCNLSCVMCNRPDHSGTSDDMPSWIIDGIISTFHELKIGEVYFCGWGEPFLSSQIFRVLSVFKQKGIPTIVQTNGTLLEALSERIIDEGPDYIDISLHGGNDTVVRKIMRGANLPILLKGIEAISILRNKAGKGPIFRRIVFCAAIENIDSLSEVVDIAARYEINEIFFQALNGSTAVIKKMKIIGSELIKGGIYSTFLSDVMEYAKKKGVAITVDPLFFLQRLNKDENSLQSVLTKVCVSPWTVIEILHTGQYRVCEYPEMPHFFTVPQGFSIGELWNAPEVISLRTGLLRCKVNEWCHSCEYRPEGYRAELQKKIRSLSFHHSKIYKIMRKAASVIGYRR